MFGSIKIFARQQRSHILVESGGAINPIMNTPGDDDDTEKVEALEAMAMNVVEHGATQLNYICTLEFPWPWFTCIPSHR